MLAVLSDNDVPAVQRLYGATDIRFSNPSPLNNLACILFLRASESAAGL
jgi:hypothetical protein